MVRKPWHREAVGSLLLEQEANREETEYAAGPWNSVIQIQGESLPSVNPLGDSLTYPHPKSASPMPQALLSQDDDHSEPPQFFLLSSNLILDGAERMV